MILQFGPITESSGDICDVSERIQRATLAVLLLKEKLVQEKMDWKHKQGTPPKSVMKKGGQKSPKKSEFVVF